MIAADPAADGARWLDVTVVPNAPRRAWVATRIVRRAARRAGVTLILPDGSRHGDGHLVLQIRSDDFFHRLAADQRVGLGESYMADEWAPGPGTDIGDLLTAFAVELDNLVPAYLTRFRRLVEGHVPGQANNTPNGSLTNIARHYDLSNDLFAAFLDETMTYSAASFDGRSDPGFDELADAQRGKVDALLDRACVADGTRVLEIGGGWGQLAIQAASRGAAVHTITLSVEQQALAQKRIADAGLTERIDVEVRDYRDIDDTYDAVVSVEMIEAVGEEYLPGYFRAVARNLKPGGWFGLQAITMPHGRLEATRGLHTWINKYIFPGGFVPSVEQIESCSRNAGLVVEDRLDLRGDYAQTLSLWRHRFTEQHALVAELGFDAVFRRLWELYLAYSEAGFRSAALGDWQFAIRRA